MALSIGMFVSSLVAIVISIRTARLPYKKKLIITVGDFVGIGMNSGIHVTATNIGNRKIKIKKIGLLIDDKCWTDFKTLSENQIVLESCDDTSHYLDARDLFSGLTEVRGNFKVYALVEDTEGQQYKKYFGRLNKLKLRLKQLSTI